MQDLVDQEAGFVRDCFNFRCNIWSISKQNSSEIALISDAPFDQAGSRIFLRLLSFSMQDLVSQKAEFFRDCFNFI
jgi:hypothetical protein